MGYSSGSSLYIVMAWKNKGKIIREQKRQSYSTISFISGILKVMRWFCRSIWWIISLGIIDTSLDSSVRYILEKNLPIKYQEN